MLAFFLLHQYHGFRLLAIMARYLIHPESGKFGLWKAFIRKFKIYAN